MSSTVRIREERARGHRVGGERRVHGAAHRMLPDQALPRHAARRCRQMHGSSEHGAWRVNACVRSPPMLAARGRVPAGAGSRTPPQVEAATPVLPRSRAGRGRRPSKEARGGHWRIARIRCRPFPAIGFGEDAERDSDNRGEDQRAEAEQRGPLRTRPYECVHGLSELQRRSEIEPHCPRQP